LHCALEANPGIADDICRSARLVGRISDVTGCCAGCERETDVAIMMDSSANIGVSKFNTLRSLASDMINLFSVETGVVRVAVVTYAQHADVNVYLGR